MISYFNCSFQQHNQNIRILLKAHSSMEKHSHTKIILNDDVCVLFSFKLLSNMCLAFVQRLSYFFKEERSTLFVCSCSCMHEKRIWNNINLISVYKIIHEQNNRKGGWWLNMCEDMSVKMCYVYTRRKITDMHLRYFKL